MKKRNIDALHDVVCIVCSRLTEDPEHLLKLHHLLIGVIELARTGREWQALNVASEVPTFIAQKAAEKGSPWIRPQNDDEVEILLKRAAVVAPTGPGFTGYMNLRCDPPKPAATVDQMRAAADAAMAADDDMDEYECDVCHKTTCVPLDSGTPKGWTDGEEYRCVECSTFGLHTGDQWKP